MRALSLLLVLAAAPAPATPADAAPVPAAARPPPVSAPASTPIARPTMVIAEPAQAAPAVAPVPVTAAQAAAATATAAKAPPAPVPQALVEKLGQGDRAFLAGDHRNALFAYQDAVYLAPRSAVARVRLGRAYLALRYPAQAAAQADQALALDPESVEARKLLDEAKAAPVRPAVQAVTSPPRTPPGEMAPVLAAPRNGATPAGAGVAAAGATAAATAPHVYRFTEPDSAASGAAAPGAPSTPTALAAAPVVATAAVVAAAPAAPRALAPEETAPGRNVAIAEFAAVGAVAAAGSDPEPPRSQAPATAVAPAAAVAPPAGGPTAAQRYRTALELLANREFDKAANELTQAIVLDPRLAVAYAARASARFGLGRYKDAADDYQAALALDANLGTPLYGLAECYRVLGDGQRASEMYQRYADSRATDVREDLRAISAKRAQELR